MIEPPLPGLTFARLPISRLDEAYAIEAASYPADEAATRDNLRLRLAEAGDYFWGASDEKLGLVGFVCGTLAHGEKLTDESMQRHVPDGKTLCVHSVVTAAPLRRKGVGRWMMKCYMAHARAAPIDRVLLLCKEHLVGFCALAHEPTLSLSTVYSNKAVAAAVADESAGLTNRGLSGVVHGQDPWLLMGCSVEGGERLAGASADAQGA